jgi:copper chaperone NosL
MKLYLDKFYEFLNRPLAMWARPVIAVLSVGLLLAFTQPLWRISMEAAQYPNGLYMDIYTYKVQGGNEGQHLQEINTLNHYIGMRKLDEAAFSDLGWIPFALGALFIYALRVAAIGDVRGLIDLAVMTTYVSLFAFGRFVYMLYNFGHHLDPRAPMKVEPFMPVVIGSKKIANFTTHSMPQAGSVFLGIFVLGLFTILAWHLVAGRRAATRAMRVQSQRA